MDAMNAALDWAFSTIGPARAAPVAMTAYSKVWRLSSPDGTFYLKMAQGSLLSEPAMCRLIASAAGPRHCPEVVGEAPQLGCFLTKSLGSSTLRERFEREGFDVLLVRKAFQALMEIQRALAPRLEECAAAGSSDWRGELIADAFDEMLLSAPFAAHGLGALEIERARRGSSILRRSSQALEAIAPGAVWSDDDFNDKNVAIDGDRFGILDLGETSIAPALLGLATSLSGFLRRQSLSEGSCEARLLRDALLDHFEIEGRERGLAWQACQDAVPAYSALCLHRLATNSSPELLLDPRYKNRMRGALAHLAD